MIIPFRSVIAAIAIAASISVYQAPVSAVSFSGINGGEMGTAERSACRNVRFDANIRHLDRACNEHAR